MACTSHKMTYRRTVREMASQEREERNLCERLFEETTRGRLEWRSTGANFLFHLHLPSFILIPSVSSSSSRSNRLSSHFTSFYGGAKRGTGLSPDLTSFQRNSSHDQIRIYFLSSWISIERSLQFNFKSKVTVLDKDESLDDSSKESISASSTRRGTQPEKL